MKYDKILTKKFYDYLKKIDKKSKVVDTEEAFYNRFKKAIESIKKQ